MSNMNFNCDVCGREVHGCNIVNGMKFCAKCYQETFGETDKDKQIAELKQKLKSQLAEIMEKIKEFVEGNAYYYEEEQYAKHIIKYLDDILKEYQK